MIEPVIKTDSLWELEEFDDHEYVISLYDPKVSLKAFVAVHSTKRGIAHGGTRFKKYHDENDALKDVLNMSKAMSYKSALANLPYGGAKAVIIEPKSKYNREDLMLSYAAKIQYLHGTFRTGTDVGLTDEDVKVMSNKSEFFLGVDRENKRNMSVSTAAAYGVFLAIKTTLGHVFGNSSAKGRVIGIKGVGKLGGELVRLLIEEGSKLIIADNNTDSVKRFNDIENVKIVDSKDIHKLKMDIYSPCALGSDITRDNVSELNCRAVVGGANNLLESDEVGVTLYENGIIYAPDYVVNSGGLIYIAEDLEESDYSEIRIKKRLKNMQQTLESIYAQSHFSETPTNDIANRIALARIGR